MREDVLAASSLASYEHRASIFCKKAEEAKKHFNSFSTKYFTFVNHTPPPFFDV